MIEILLGIIAMVAVQAFALDVVKGIITAWTWVLTLAMPREARDSHRAEVHSTVYEQITHYREDGHFPPSIAARLIVQEIRGLKDHLALALPYAPQTLAEYLDRGSTALWHCRPHPMVMSALTMLILINFTFWTSQDEYSWVTWGFWNVCVIVMAMLSSRRWAPWLKKSLTIAAYGILLAILGIVVWVVVQHRLYESPYFETFVTVAGIVSVAYWFAVLAGRKLLQDHTLGQRRWALLAVFGIAILGSVVAAHWTSGTAEYVAATWVYAGLYVGILATTVMVAMFCAVFLWRGGTWVASKSMRTMANIIRS